MALTEKEELELLQLEEEEYQQSLKKQEPSEPQSDIPISDVVKGQALQGALFGFGDEAVAAGSAALDVLENPQDNKLQQYKDLYNKYLQDERKQLQKEAESAPNIAAGSALAGGIATIPLMPAKIGLAGAAGLGAVSGLGTSEAEDISELAKDVGTGALVGGALQKAIPAFQQVPKGIKKTGEIISDIPILKDTLDALKGATKGKSYSGQIPKYEKDIRETSKNALDLLKELNIKKVADQDKLLSEATKSGTAIDSAPELLSTYSKLKNLNPQELAGKEQRQLARELEKFIEPTVKGSELVGQTPEELNKTIKNLSNLLKSKESSSVKDLGLDLLSNLKSKIQDTVPGLKQTNKELSDTINLFERASGKSPQDYLRGLNEADNQALVDRLSGIIKKTDETIPARLEDIVEGFGEVKGLKTYAPDVGDYIEKQAKEQARDLELAKLASGDVKYFGERLGTLGVKGGELAGKGVKAVKEGVKQITSPIVKTTQQASSIAKDKALATINKTTPQSIQILSQKAAQKGKEHLVRLLETAAGSPDQKRTAIMFGIMQNPEYRQTLNEIGGDILGTKEEEE